MPEIKAIKHKATVNAFDFNFFADNMGKHESLQKVAIVTPIAILNFQCRLTEN
ncbi:hypothetical protein [Veillonella parvula]|uniref:hypothetical protein n=1 Tax=Veillonella parvula TaxID=29466 RepID=UPI0028EE32CE|nr:hypothetical protein [Veillonella parvula]